MALAKNRMGSVQTCAFSENALGDISSPRPYGFGEYQAVLEEGDVSEKSSELVKNVVISHSSSHSSPSSSNSSGFVFQATNYQPEEAHSLINFKTGYDNIMHANRSLLSFEQNERVPQNTYLKVTNHKDEYSVWEDNVNHNYQWNQINPKCSTDPRLLEDFNSFQTASSYGSITDITKENRGDWLHSDATIVADSIHESGLKDASFHKRPHTGESMQALKKQCTTSSATRKPKSKSVPSKDPQSIAAKNRRERISERLKVLQELVPNGSKVDLVTMLEKAISYVKFLQLQVKVLATDEFWPVQGGKAPDISQVKEAIDAILLCQRESISSSK